jgi:hypothetical protein
MAEKTERPAFATDELLEYLDELRESGVTNMYGAGSYLEAEFALDNKESTEVLIYWMHSFGERHPK